MPGIPEFIALIVMLGAYLGFAVFGAWIYDRFVRPRLYSDTSQ